MVFTTATSASDGLAIAGEERSRPLPIRLRLACLLSRGRTSRRSRFLNMESAGVTVRAGKILTYGPGMASYYGAFAYAQWTNYTTFRPANSCTPWPTLADLDQVCG